MRFLLAACLALSLHGQAPQGAVSSSAPSAYDQPLTIRLEGQAQSQPTSHVAEYLGGAAELLRAVMWPLVFATLLLTQRRPLTRLLEALVEVVQHSNRIKVGDMIDVEVDRSAKAAQTRDMGTIEVSPSEIEAAARVGRMAESSDLSAIRVRLMEFAHEYEATRSNMKPGAERTRAMNAIVAKMRTLAIAAVPLLREFADDKESPGRRLVALAILQLAPDLAYVEWVVERMSHEQPFLLFHGSLVLLAMVRSYGARSGDRLEAALSRSLEIVKSFSGGPPDANTIKMLQMARAELGEGGRQKA